MNNFKSLVLTLYVVLCTFICILNTDVPHTEHSCKHVQSPLVITKWVLIKFRLLQIHFKAQAKMCTFLWGEFLLQQNYIEQIPVAHYVFCPLEHLRVSLCPTRKMLILFGVTLFTFLIGV